MIALAVIALVFALIPCVLFLCNLRLYSTPRAASSGSLQPVSVLIPARNEEANIARAMSSVLANRDVELELIVLDDHSTDRTAALVLGLARNDARVRLETAPILPVGWCGKQHACSVLAGHARHPWLVFMDADVSLAPDALGRMVAFARAKNAALASGVPRQELASFGEKLLIPLIHFVLLGFLPVSRMRRSQDPAYAAGCGQLFIARASAYRASGGHAAIRTSLHDGLKLPWAFRTAGFRTDLFDATEVASCRMYQNGREVLAGLAKNATEGLASPARIGPVTLLLAIGQVLPFVMLCLPGIPTTAFILFLVAALCAWLPRWLAVKRFRQPWTGAALHPVGVVALLAIQWLAFFRSLNGRPATWRGRSYVQAAVIFLVLAGPGRAATNTPHRLHSFQLKDQYEQARRYDFPKTNLSFVVVADQKGADQLSAWIQPVHDHFAARIDIDGVADMSPVPSPLRGMVRRSFLKQSSYPVMLDWEGAVVKQFHPRPKVANVYVVAKDGTILESWSGPATREQIKKLLSALDRHTR